MLDRDGQTVLNDLRWHWDDAYDVDYREGKWLAAPKADPFAIISRDTSGELREALRADYAARAARRFGGSCST